jgi:lipopolysaccharide/colanic/teichoic acid biosynthesis glycosyltransferase
MSKLFASSPSRLLDTLGAAAALVLLSPVLLAVACAVRLSLGRPVLFRQIRPGYLQKPFTIYKFRTMSSAVDTRGRLLPDVQRTHRLGIFLRRTSLDELPQLWNVLRGDMSLVGPRPLLMKYLPFYTSEERIRFTVRPGMTGWAQLNGRHDAMWNDRLQNDVSYVRNRSLRLDLRIIWMTIHDIVKRRKPTASPSYALLNLDEERAGMGAGSK